MATTRSAVPAFCEQLDLYRHWQTQIAASFFRDREQQAQLSHRLLELALSLSATQVRQMEQAAGRGIPTSEFTREQKVLLLEIELALRALRLLDTPPKLREARTVDFRGTGLVRITWERQPLCPAVMLYWLPYDRCALEGRQSFREAQAVCRARAQWLLEQHALDATRLTSCSRLLFQLALTMSPEQIVSMAEPDALWVTELDRGQRTLLEAAARTHPSYQPGAPEPFGARFDPNGLCWLIYTGESDTSCCGIRWLPSSWQHPERELTGRRASSRARQADLPLGSATTAGPEPAGTAQVAVGI